MLSIEMKLEEGTTITEYKYCVPGINIKSTCALASWAAEQSMSIRGIPCRSVAGSHFAIYLFVALTSRMTNAIPIRILIPTYDSNIILFKIVVADIFIRLRSLIPTRHRDL